MKRYIQYMLLCMTCAVATVSCDKEPEIRTQGSSLGTIEVSADEGHVSVAVNTSGIWYVGEADHVGWISFDDTVGKDNGAFTVYYDSNKSDLVETHLRRMARIVVSTADKYTADTLYLKQNGVPAVLRFKESVIELPVASGEYSTDVTSNIPAGESGAIRIYPDQTWIRNVRFDNSSKVGFTLDTASAERSGNITLEFTDAWGETSRSVLEIIQK